MFGISSAQILKWWHAAGIAASVSGVVATNLAPVAKAFPTAAPAILGLGAVSLGVSSFMNKVASDKVVAAIIADPNAPTPQGFGLPTPVEASKQ